MSTPVPVLEATDIQKRFGGTVALSGGNLSVLPGEVHAIVGENGAGKSTLMNIISGSLAPDSGTIRVDGETVSFATVLEAANAGIGIVHQELTICPDVSIMENLFLGKAPTGAVGNLDYKQMYSETKKYMEMFGVDCDPKAAASSLTIGQQQVIEIARAISSKCSVVIFDEPTSSLSEAESDALFDVIANLTEQGIACIYISHRLSEVFAHCDRVTIMRDGKWVETVSISQTSPSQVVSAMVGREVAGLYPPKSSSCGDVALEVQGLSDGNLLEDISFSARYGEILGLSGLVGSGRTELMRAVCGIDRHLDGIILLEGAPMQFRTYGDATRRGLCYMSEDRKNSGLFLERSIDDNAVAAILDRLGRFGVIPRGAAATASKKHLQQLAVKYSNGSAPVSSLSGGNQQKVMIAKWLLAEPKVLILDEPTRGIDVGAKYEIHRLLRELADEGMAVIIISSEIQEIVGLSDQVLVMREGRVVGALEGEEIEEDAIIALAAGSAAA